MICQDGFITSHGVSNIELMEDEEVRNAFLAAVLGINLEEIVESRILPSHLRQKDKADKLGILDVRVLLNNKEQIDIEIQVTSSDTGQNVPCFIWERCLWIS